jgi:hypothetical protein
MLQHILYEIVGAGLVALGVLMVWLARPVEGRPAHFLRAKERYEVGYALATVFTVTGGLASMLLGFTT